MGITPVPEVTEELAAEIRIQQSVQVIRNMPVLIGGNATAVGVLAIIDWSNFTSSYSYIPAAILVLLLVPLMVSYPRLWRAKRPERVSRRRIRRIEIHSLLMGLAWAVVMALFVPSVDATNQVIILMVMAFIWYGSTAALPSMPRAALEYSLPCWFSANASFFLTGSHNPIFISILLWIAGIAIIVTCRQNWSNFRTTVALELEREGILRENLEREANRHSVIAETQRNLIEAMPVPLILTKKGSVLPIGTQAARLFKIPGGDLASHQMSDFFVDQDDRRKIVELQETEGRLDAFEVQMKDAQGNPFWAMASSRPIMYEGEQCFLNSIISIDERKRMEREIAGAKEQAEAGELKISVNEYLMQDVVANVLSNVQSLATEKKLALSSDLAPDLPVGIGDERRLTQVLVNLVGNAIKFTDEGEVMVGVTTVADDFCVSVTDTGVGISEQDQIHILDEFYQADASTTRAHNGTELGLAIAKRMVELHGGHLSIKSTLGEGSTFTFHLPIRATGDVSDETVEAVQ